MHSSKRAIAQTSLPPFPKGGGTTVGRGSTCLAWRDLASAEMQWTFSTRETRARAHGWTGSSPHHQSDDPDLQGLRDPERRPRSF